MKQKFLILFSLLIFIVTSSCKEKAKSTVVYNPFATPEGCVKEYLDAEEKCDMHRLLNCFSYEPKYERILREGLERQLAKDEDNKRTYPDYHYKVDQVKTKEVYPNSAVVTVYYTQGFRKDENFSSTFEKNLVKDGANWKIEAVFSYSIKSSY